jgi:peroxiredoxin
MKYTLFVFAVILAAVSCTRSEKKEAAEEGLFQSNDFPNMQVRLLNGNALNAKTFDGKTVLVLFQPDCDHCQHEAEQIENNLSAFSDYNVYFVSSSPVEEIKKFANDYKLSGIPNVLFGLTTTESILNNFGAIQAPSIYIYSHEGKLVKHFNGQVEVGEIMKYL